MCNVGVYDRIIYKDAIVCDVCCIIVRDHRKQTFDLFHTSFYSIFAIRQNISVIYTLLSICSETYHACDNNTFLILIKS